MSDAEETEAPAGEEKGKGKGKKDKSGGRSNLVPAIVLAVGMLGAGYFLGPGSATNAAEAGTTTTEAPPAGMIAKIEPININLADGHFLRVGMGLQLIEGLEAKEFEAGLGAKATDIIIELLGGSDMAEISTPEGRDHVKAELKKHLEEAYEGEVLDVYFTDFVMQ